MTNKGTQVCQLNDIWWRWFVEARTVFFEGQLIRVVRGDGVS